jgi:hypothetical protein
MVELTYLGMTLTGQNCIHEETKIRLNLGNACYHSVKDLLTSCPPSENMKVEIYGTLIRPVVFHGCETSSLTFSKDYRLKVLENRSLRRIF